MQQRCVSRAMAVWLSLGLVVLLAACTGPEPSTDPGPIQNPPDTNPKPPAPKTEASLGAWVGPASSELKVWLSDDLSGADFFGTSDLTCAQDEDLIPACEHALTQLAVADADTFNSPALTLSQAGYFHLRQGENRFATGFTGRHFSPRDFSPTVVFQGRLWMVGSPGGNALVTDIWSSGDGVAWVEEVAEADFGVRNNGSLVVFDDGLRGERLWVVGAYNKTTFENEVWSSPDGRHWQRETDAPGFSARWGFSVVAFNTRLWLLGGADAQNTLLKEVWSSPDGVTWTLETLSGVPFTPRQNHQVAVFNAGGGERLWLVGGDTVGGSSTGVWSSADGRAWRQEAAATALRAVDAQMAVFDDGTGARLWRIEMQGSLNNTVWSSSDGVAWHLETDTAPDPLNARSGADLVVFDGGDGERLWVIGGDGRVDTVSSSDGKAWQVGAGAQRFTARMLHQAIPFDAGDGERLWVMGGYSVDNLNNVWSSTDGLTWVQAITNNPFSKRQDHQVVAFDDGRGTRLWLVGGAGGDGILGVYLNDVWSSEDGVNWDAEPVSQSFPGRAGHQLVVFDDGQRGPRLWVIGGEDYDETYGDVWSSADGRDWTLETDDDSPLPARTDAQVVVFDDGQGAGEQLWLIGGFDGGDHNDVWSSADGKDWVQVTGAADFPIRSSHQVVVFDDGRGAERLWLVGGYGNDVWSSADGKTWDQETEAADFPPIIDHQVVRFDDGTGDRLWLLGGNTLSGLSNEVWRSVNGRDWQLGRHVPLTAVAP
ncbi:hypothetical protein [Saccharospirillum mangrovi]|uniref:hypothetical protein n=1 Tax=Saccharospirillum mangrovi TaxID=2161747 RepID=UPI0013008099|nr:hypothetical protein [Saccharospirillum mangrovi]